jgi:transketolase
MRATEFAHRFPDRVFEVGFAEQNAVAVAAGLASCGLIPFVGTYAGFITMRACEQLRTFVAYPGLPVRFVGANGGIFAGEREGVTHQFFEDIGITRTIPGITVAVPSDAGQTYKATQAIAYIEGPAYLRIGSGREPDLFDRETPFELGKGRILAEHGRDVAIIATGLVVGRAMRAAEELATRGIQAIVLEMPTLKPLDGELLENVLRATGAAVTVEDHNVIGGLGSAVAEYAAEHCPTPIIRVGLQDIFPESGEAEAVLDAYGMGIADIVLAAQRVVRNNA